MGIKVYNPEDIMKQSIGLSDKDVENADYNADSAVTAKDARTALRLSKGLDADTEMGVTGEPGQYTDSDTLFQQSKAYQNQADAILAKYKNQQDFQYDFNEDAVFQSLREQYMRDGKLASQNAAGQAAALSGGYSNSYGATAAGQAYMSAIDELYDVVPELEDRAYNRYLQGRNEELAEWEIAQNRADKERGYAETERAYSDSRKAYEDNLRQIEWDKAYQRAQMGDFSALKNLGVDTENSEYTWNLEKALSLAELGDYSALKNMGIDTTKTEYAWNLQKALSLAEIGDYSELEAMGVDVSDIKKQKELEFAVAAAQFGDYSFLKKLGVNVDLFAAYGSSGSGGGTSGRSYSRSGSGSGGGSGSYTYNSNAQNSSGPSQSEAAAIKTEMERLQALIQDPESKNYGRAILEDASKKYNKLKAEYIAKYGE